MCSRAVFKVPDAFGARRKNRNRNRSMKTAETRETIKYYNRDRRSATDNDDYSDRAMLKPNIPAVGVTHPTMSLLRSEFHKVSPRHVVSFKLAALISIRGSSFLWTCGLFRQSEGTGDEYDDTDFFLDIYICLFC